MIPVCEPTLNGNELKYVEECVKTGWISSKGKFINKFEEKFSEFCEVKHAAAVSNGTTAIHIALEALGIGKGDEVIIPTFTMIATSNAVAYAQAKPVLVDSELETWNMDVNKIEEKITKKTKAIMVVHTYGHPVDMDLVNKLAKKYGLYVIEDAAEAHGGEYKGRKVGNLSDVACFSFYANKIITTGEGGMVVSNDEKVIDKVKSMRDHSFSKKKRFLHEEFGFNYRLTNLQAAIGVAQMEHINKFVENRIKNAQYYNKYLGSLPGLTLPPKKDWAKNVYWMYGILSDFAKGGVEKDELMKKLLEKGIDTRSFFIPMHKQPLYWGNDDRWPDCSGKYPQSEILEKNGLYLPSSSHLTKEEMNIVIGKVKEVWEENKKN